MSLLKRLFDAVGGTASTAFTNVVETVRTVFAGDPETRRKVAFSVAMIALSAKMAKADGVVSQEEVAAFQDIFAIPDEEAHNVARLYNLAKQDVAGYDIYAERIAGLCGSGLSNCAMLEDILDGLFHIAKADSVIHQKELEFIAHVADIFGFDEEHFDRIMARHVHPDGIDPYQVLGVEPDAPFAEVRRRYRKLAADSHPDALLARGVPQEFLAIANDRMAAINAAFSHIEKQRVPA
ncbi:MAG: molecular chaperone DjlA [Rhizobiales bacterium]|nr:molecular chaperone DjlA [Hyphomicrobiales bacterium]MBA69808.1 molecular chaperone DjlA [Hyphomicrobiales bacterium]|tara:strand:- start:16 stop:726 length:711 start_codon:yes stop_codon:yes gene_type:complete